MTTPHMLLDHLTDTSNFKSMANSNMFGQSPVITIPAVQPDQYFASSHYAASTAGQSPGVLSIPLTPSASIPPTPGSLAGRKRSRGDVFADVDDIQPDGSLPTPTEEVPQCPREEPVMGEGMTLSYPAELGYGNTAENQSTVDQSNVRKTFQLQHIHRPSVSSRKSQRLDSSSSNNDELAQLVLPSTMREATTEPLIDEATRVLGISWTRMDSSEALLINQAAYNKFIQNHYSSLKDVTVWFENSALPAYLVVATNVYTNVREYYLFSHNLLEARLVTREASELLPRLQMLPAIELAAPAGQIRAETDSQIDANAMSADATARQVDTRGRPQEQVPSQDRNVEPANESRELLCTAHEMELD